MADVRVVSLLPSATELIAYIILRNKENSCLNGGTAHRNVDLVGVSHECDFPPSLTQGKPQLTSSIISFTTSKDVDRQVREHLQKGNGLYSIDEKTLELLKPDVIVTQSLCRVCSVDYCLVERIAATLTPRPTIVDTNPQSLHEILEDLTKIGSAIQLEDVAAAERDALEKRIERVANLGKFYGKGCRRKTVAFLEWTDPIFVGGHWTPQLIRIAGGDHPLNPAADEAGAGKSVTVTSTELVQCNPDVIIIAPCGLDLRKTAKEVNSSLLQQSWWNDMSAVRKGNVHLVDGNQMFNRPGPRVVDALEWLCFMLHDECEEDAFEGVGSFPTVMINDIESLL